MSGKITSKFREELKKQILKSEFNKHLTYKETDEFNRGNKILTCTISGRIPKTKETEFNEFKENLFELAETYIGENSFEILEKIFEITFGAGIGEKYNPIEVFDLKGNKTTINSEQGKVSLIDFWATWCKFCQEPMEENIKLAKEALDSNDLKNTNIIGLSCDEDESKWKEHIKVRNWENIQHYNKPNVLKVLNLVGIPQILIIGKDGFIKFLGPPRNIELKETLINLNMEKEIIFKKEIWDNDSKTNNNWNFELNEEEKEKIVNEMNNTFNEKGANKAELIIYSKSVMDMNGKMNKKTQVFLQGEIMGYENEIVENCITTLEKKYSLGNIANQIKVVDMNLDEDF